MPGYSPKNLIKNSEPYVIQPSLTAQPMFKTSIYAKGATDCFIAAFFCSGIAGTVSIQMQHSIGRNVWENITGKTVALANGWNYIKINRDADTLLMPLYDTAQFVLTSDGSGAGLIEVANILQES